MNHLSLNRVMSLALIPAILLYPLVLFNFVTVRAASLSTITIKDGTADFTVSDANPQVVIKFTPVTTITTGTILTVSYDTAFIPEAGFGDDDVTLTGTNFTSVESNFASGTFKSTLTTTGAVGEIVITIGDGIAGAANLNDLASPTAGNYNFTITVDIGGAGTTYDLGSGLAYVGNENDVQVSATVAPVIDMEIFQVGLDTLLDPNTCELGLLAINDTKECSYDIGIGTNSPAGVDVKVRDNGSPAGLYNASASYELTAVSDGTVTPGFEEYGFTFGLPGAGTCSFTGDGGYTTSDKSVPTAETTVFHNGSTCDIGDETQHVTVTHKASVSTGTRAGSYTQNVTYTAYSR